MRLPVLAELFCYRCVSSSYVCVCLSVCLSFSESFQSSNCRQLVLDLPEYRERHKQRVCSPPEAGTRKGRADSAAEKKAATLCDIMQRAEAAWCGCREGGRGQAEALKWYKQALRAGGRRDVAVMCSYANFVLQHASLPKNSAELALQQALDLDPSSAQVKILKHRPLCSTCSGHVLHRSRLRISAGALRLR